MRRVAFGQWLFAEPALSQRQLLKWLGRQVEYLNALWLPLNVLERPTSARLLLVAWLVLLFVLARQFFARRKGVVAAGLRDPLWFFGPVWYAATIIPLLGTYWAPRHLCLSSAGFCLAVVLLLQRLFSERLFKCAVVLLLVSYSLLLLRYELIWRTAARLSAQIRAEVETATQALPAGSGLILDAPMYYRGVYVWYRAANYALRPPFVTISPYERLRVLESPASYCCPFWRRDKAPLIASLVSDPAPACFITVDASGQVRRKSLSQTETKDYLAACLSELARDDLSPAWKWKNFWAARLK